MADIAITVDGGTTKKLLTAGKYCDRNIVVTATGGGGEPEPPQDGKTRLYIHVPPNSEPGRPPARNQVPLYIQQTVSQGVTIDWGDGSEPETLEGTGKVNTTHTYQEGGDFVIALEVAEGCELGLGHGSSSYCVIGSTSNNSRVYCSMLQKVVLGNGLRSIDSYAFYYCQSLSSISISEDITNIGGNAFQYCYSLSNIVIPESVIDIGNSAFYNCYSLLNVVIPQNINSIGDRTFYNCYSLSNVVIPQNVNSIGDSAFYGCASIPSITIPDSITTIKGYAFGFCHGTKEYHLKPTAPPEMLNKNVFTSIPNDCIIFVPKNRLYAYKLDTNWAIYADQMQEEPS